MLKTVQVSGGGGGGNGVTQVNTGTGLSGGPITTTGTISLANTTEVAKKALIACLVISADSTDIHSILSVIGDSNCPMCFLSLFVRTPTTTRSGFRNTSKALPNRRFSRPRPQRTGPRPHTELSRQTACASRARLPPSKVLRTGRQREESSLPDSCHHPSLPLTDITIR